MSKIITASYKKGLFLLAMFGIMFLVSGCSIVKTPTATMSLDLEVWGLFDDSDTFSTTIAEYKKINPSITIKYKKLDPDTYKNELIESLAANRGPDIILIQNSWLRNFADKITPAPAEIITEQGFRKEFVDVVANDFIGQGKVYATPLSVDNLALFYNKDIFNQAGIVDPPKTWQEFVEDVKKTTKLDELGQIRQSGAAMGTAYNINRSTDILNLLFLQYKTPMYDAQQGQAKFQQGVGALDFYTSFAKMKLSSSVENQYYSWNPKMHYSVDAFSEGNLAMMLNYSWQIETIKSKSPKLNFAIAPVPQLNIDDAVTYPNYWAFTVVANKANITSNGKKVNVSNNTRIAEAWKFLKFLTMKPVAIAGQPAPATLFDAAAKYAQETGKPSGRRDLIEGQRNSVGVGVFAQQNLVAKNWQQSDPVAIETIFAEMIDKVNKGGATTNEAIQEASRRVTQVMGGK